MKLRFTNDKIRIRLDQSDIDALKDQGLVELVLRLGFDEIDVFKTSVILTESLIPSIKMINKHIRVYLPADSIYKWLENQEVIFSYNLELTKFNTLTLLIEFDMPCFHEKKIKE